MSAAEIPAAAAAAVDTTLEVVVVLLSASLDASFDFEGMGMGSGAFDPFAPFAPSVLVSRGDTGDTGLDTVGWDMVACVGCCWQWRHWCWCDQGVVPLSTEDLGLGSAAEAMEPARRQPRPELSESHEPTA